MTRKNKQTDALVLALTALSQVAYNEEYQKLSGYPHFTSAPTEYECKHKMQTETAELVKKAIEEIADVLGKDAKIKNER